LPAPSHRPFVPQDATPWFVQTCFGSALLTGTGEQMPGAFGSVHE
jgi:hypothetical protein